MIAAVIEPVRVKVSVAATDLRRGRLDPDMGNGLPHVERYLRESRDRPHTMCLRRGREFQVMNPSAGSAHPEVQPLESCEEVIASVISQLVTSCVTPDQPLFPTPPETQRLRRWPSYRRRVGSKGVLSIVMRRRLHLRG